MAVPIVDTFIRGIRYTQQWSHKLHRHWSPDFTGSVKCFIADKPECNINLGSDCVSPLSKHYSDLCEIGRQVFEGFFCSE